MIRFFTNYSYGGYEELYLGSYADREQFRYHLPLLPIKKAKLADDPSNKKLADEVERLSQYVLIQKNGKTDEGTLPEGAFTIISNPGYSIICRRCDDQFVVAVSDVASDDHDEMGGGKRENPFTMLFVFNQEDTHLMDALLYELLTKEEMWRDLICHLFVYDPTANGLRFSLGDLNQALKKLETVSIAGINHKTDVPLIVLENNYQLDYTLEIQKLTGKSVGVAYDAKGELLKGTALMPAVITDSHEETDDNVKHSDPADEQHSDSAEEQQSVSADEQNSGSVDEQHPDPKEEEKNANTDNAQSVLSPKVEGPSKEEIEANLRDAIRKEEREKAWQEIRQYQKQMDEKEQTFVAERKKIIRIAIGVAVGAFILGAIIF